MPLTQESEFINRAKEGDQEAVAAVLASQEKLVRHVANRMGRVTTSYEDLIQAGNLGVLLALKTFDPSTGNKLSTYAKPFVLDEVSKAVAESRQGFAVANSTAKRYWRSVKSSVNFDDATELAVAEGMDPASFLAAHHALTGVVSIDRSTYSDDDDEGRGYEPTADEDHASSVTDAMVARSMIAEGFQVLDARERTVLEMAYGLNGHPDDLTDGAIAEALGVDRSRINRIRNRALTKVREFFTNQTNEEA